MMKRTRVFILSFFVLILPVFPPALIRAAENEGITSSTNLSLQVSTRPEAKLSLTQSFIFPFLQGSGPLTSGSNIRADITAEVSPVSLAGTGSVIWTPIAFLELDAGGRLGTGWNMPLGNGIGLNRPIGVFGGTPREMEINGSAFDGLHWSAWAGGAFQFDLAAVVPGDWNHVIFRAYDELRYSAYTRAGSADSWILENDDGENLNGWTWYGSLVLGYQMPLSPVFDFTGLMGEYTFNLYDVPGKNNWGGNLGQWIFSGFFNFTFTPEFSTTMIVQMRTRRNYGDCDFENLNNIWYQDRQIMNDGGNLRLVFYRAAFIFTCKIR